MNSGQYVTFRLQSGQASMLSFLLFLFIGDLLLPILFALVWVYKSSLYNKYISWLILWFKCLFPWNALNFSKIVYNYYKSINFADINWRIKINVNFLINELINIKIKMYYFVFQQFKLLIDILSNKHIFKFILNIIEQFHWEFTKNF